jgi:PilZ domain
MRSSPRFRRSPRINVNGRLLCEIVTLPAEVTIHDVSLGGMRVDANVPAPIDSVQTFRISCPKPSAWAIELAAKVVYCCRVSSSDGSSTYVWGCQFPDAPQTKIDEMLEHVTSVLTLE